MSEKEYKDKCESMFKKNTILINENEHLKQQIEKMKDYGNCKYGIYGNMCSRNDTKCCNGCDNWELAE